MPFEDFARVLDSVAAATDPHGVMVNITGGEPLMRADLADCGRKIYEKGFPWGMVTNGYALTKERYDSLLRCGLRSVTVSLDGLDKSHDWMRGREGSFDKASRAIKIISDSGETAFDVVTCVNSRNLQELPALKEHLVSLGVKEWRLFTVFPAGRALSDKEMFLSPEQLKGLMDFILQTRKEGRIKASFACEGFLKSYEGAVRDHFYFCGAGITVGSVLADGSISACPSIRSDYHQGNIYRDDFMSVWEQRFQPYRDREWMHGSKCAKCRWWRWCRGGGMHLRDSDGRLIQCLTEAL